MAVLAEYHGENTHCSRDAMLEAMGEKVWWPKQREDVSEYIRGCDGCQRRKPATHRAPLRSIIAERPMERWQYDFTGPFNKAGNGVMDELKKLFEAEGKPEYLQSDNGKEFKNNDLEIWY